MPPKKPQPTTSKKAEQKKKEKVIEVRRMFLAIFWEFSNKNLAENCIPVGQDVWTEEQEGGKAAEIYLAGGETGEKWWTASSGTQCQCKEGREGEEIAGTERTFGDI